MISLLPSFRETLVLRWNARDTYERLAASTSNKPFLQGDEQELLFSGWVLPERMRISLRSRRPTHYAPLVIGRLEGTSSGCLLLLKYTLFPTTRVLVQLWSVFIVLSAAIASYQLQNPYYLSGGALLLAAIYFIVWSNFQLQLRPLREAIHRVVA